jgi:hypothetical protein
MRILVKVTKEILERSKMCQLKVYKLDYCLPLQGVWKIKRTK